MAGPVTVGGDVTYREGIELPANASLTVKLLDISQPSPAIIVQAVSPIPSRGQIPIQFKLNYDDSLLRSDQAYGIEANIIANGQLWFRNETPVPFSAPGALGPLTVVVSFAGEIRTRADSVQPAQAYTTSLNVSAGLTDTLWHVERIGVRHATTRATLTIASDRRAGGTAACNNFFAEAVFDGPKLTFEDLVATKRLCPASLLSEERAFLAALSAVRGYRLIDSRLDLLDGKGTRVLRLRRTDR